jgi:hypothetical protein
LPAARKHLRFKPEKMFAKDDVTQNNEKAYGEFWTSDLFHEMVDAAPIDIDTRLKPNVVAIILEHDKTPLSKNGFA